MSIKSESSRNNIKKIVAGAIGFFILISLYVNEFSWFANTFDRNKLIFIGLFLGLLAGLGVAYKLMREDQEIIEKFQLTIGMMVIGAMLMPLIFSMTNRLGAFSSPMEESVEFVKNDAFNESRFGKIPQENPDGYYAFVVRKGTVIRLTTKTPIYQENQKGDRVLLPIKKGLWGFEIAYPHLLHE